MKNKNNDIIMHYFKIYKCIYSSKTSEHLDGCKNMIDTFMDNFSSGNFLYPLVEALIDKHSAKYLTI